MVEKHDIITRFISPAMTAREYIIFSQRVLIELGRIHEIFRNLHGWGKSASAWQAIDADFTNFDELVLKQIDKKK